MRETLTISLPKRLRRDLERMARAEGVTSSEYVRRAIKADLFRRALRAARRELVPQARARGIYTDEDVFIKRQQLTLKNSTFCPITYYVLEKLISENDKLT